jgi:hypothetical protein
MYKGTWRVIQKRDATVMCAIRASSAGPEGSPLRSINTYSAE